MKIKGLKISVFMLLLSICACGFVSLNNKSIEVHAATETSTNCYYLLGEDGVAYESNTSIGSIEGLGEFVVGENAVSLTAKANENYQLVGWRIVYEEQENRVEFFDTEGLTAGFKTITLTAKDKTENEIDDPKQIPATLTFTKTNGYYSSGTFALANVFEDIKVNPVFDHIYYQTNINSLVEISSFENHVDINGDTLYYETSVETEGVTEYKNSYIKIGDNYNYYGSVFAESGEYYTIHKTLTDNPEDEKVPYAKGAFRFGETVDFSFDVDVAENNFIDSKNVDIKSFSVSSNRTNNLFEYKEGVTSNYYKIQKDSYLRTLNYNINFEIEADSNYVNTVNAVYHDLYLVDVNLLVDGSSEHDEDVEILGKMQVSSTEIRSNLSIYNFYSIVDLDNLCFFAKTSANNNSRSFGLNSISTINGTTENGTFRYYTFSDIDGSNNKSIYYSILTQNLEINVNYSSVTYEVEFGVAEHKVDSNLNPVISEMDIDAPASLYLSRGESLLSGETIPMEDVGEIGDYYFDKSSTLIYEKSQSGWELISDYDGLSIVGYEFIGFASSLTSSVETDYEYTVNRDEPAGTKVWLCFDKVEHSIVVTNYNKVSINSATALDALTFTRVTSAGQTTEILNKDALVGTSVTLSTLKLKLGETLLITHKLNNGFDVKYSLLSPTEIQDLIDSGKTDEEMEQYYLNSFELTESFISNNVADTQVTIYVYEEKLEYTLTYLINVENDGDANFVMGSIDIINISEEQSNDNFTITKYDLENVEISEENNNLTADVSKFVVTGLYLNDSITLKSVPKPFEDSTYVFNWFVDGKTTLSYIQDGNNFNHIETVSRTRTIQVVYSIPIAQVYIALDDDFANTPEFNYSYEIRVDGEVATPVDSVLYPNQYSITVGKVLTITVGGLGFGYNFVGYQVNEKAINKVDGFTFNHTTLLGANEIVLKFERVKFQFYFEQYEAIINGKEMNGEYVEFGEDDYIELDVDHTFASINKPAGYYVRTALIDGTEFNANVENNVDFRSLLNNSIYGFNLAREDFINTVTILGKDENEDGVIEVYVELTYSIYKYDIIINNTDPQGKPHSTNVQYLRFQIGYSLNGKEHLIDYPYTIDRVIFEAVVPYGANANVNVLGSLQTGLRFVGWAYIDTNLVTMQNGTKYLNLGKVCENREYLYLFTYEAHKLVLDFNAQQGNPTIEVNNEPANPLNATINLFDSIKVTAGAIRANGYKFKAFVVNMAIYTPYVYDETTWKILYNNLYYLDGHAYVKNSTAVYNSDLRYYTYTIKEERFSEAEELTIGQLILSNFEIQSKCLTITVEYELLQLTIVNETIESDEGTITHELLKDIIDFRIEDLIVLTISATENQGEPRDIGPEDTVTFNDAVTIKVEINKNATEYLTGKGYNLALGVRLKEVQVSGIIVNITNLDAGEYSIGFGVGEFMPELGEEIKIIYTVAIEQKNVAVTTIVTESSNFYENVYMYADSDSTFGGSKDSNNKSVLDTNWQFMAPLSSYTLMSRDYKKLFKTSGVKIYLTEYNIVNGEYSVVGDEIKPEDYGQYGLAIEMVSRNVAGVGEVQECQVKIDRLLYNFRIIFQVQPIITYNGGPRFEKTFDCNSDGSGKEQFLIIGSTSDANIQVAEEIKDAISIKYQLMKDGVLSGTDLDSVINVGEYKVKVSFDTTASYDWLSGVSVTENIVLVIKPKDIALIYDTEAIASNQVERIYNKSSSFNVANIFKYLIITDRVDLNIRYDSVLSTGSGNLKLDSNIACYISSGGKDEITFQANESVFYNLYVYNIALQNTEFNKNFNLITEDLIIESYIKIKRLAVDLEGLAVYSKVYDGTDKAELDSTKDDIKLSKQYYGDDVIISIKNLVVKFEDYSVGDNKTVIIDASTALGGNDAHNYSINSAKISGLKIYPYSVSATVRGYGEVKLFNKRGLTDKDYVALIPINASLEVRAIRPDTSEYSKIHGKISEHLKGNNEFRVAYTLTLTVNGVKTEIDKNLYLSVPNVQNITGVYLLDGSKTDTINYKTSKKNIVIDLSQTSLDVDSVFITQKRILLKPWQIVVIVTGAVALITAGILTFVILRKRKFKEYSVHDKI